METSESIQNKVNNLLDNIIYFRFDEPTEWENMIVSAYNIEPKSGEKRIRVYCNQFLYDVLEDITLKNYLKKTGIFYLYGENLRNNFPEYEERILEAYFTFWQSVQTKLKRLKSLQ